MVGLPKFPLFPQFDYAACVIITINEMNANIAICLFLARHMNTNTQTSVYTEWMYLCTLLNWLADSDYLYYGNNACT